MPLIGPPRDSYPPPESEEIPKSGRSNEWYEQYFNVPNWICPICVTTNFGRNEYCAGCFGKNGIKNPRPPR